MWCRSDGLVADLRGTGCLRLVSTRDAANGFILPAIRGRVQEFCEMSIPGFFGAMISGVFAAAVVFLEEIGRMLVLLARSLGWLVRPPYRFGEFLRQLDFVGAQSALLIVLTGGFTGMVMGLQGYNGLHRYGAESLVGATAALMLSRELGPVISALMVIGRVGSSMTAELGAMRTTQQIDALASMAVDPVQYLVVPRLVAATVMLPLLAGVFAFSGMVGTYMISVHYLGIDAGMFMSGITQYLVSSDITHGLVKALVFGLMFSLIACYKGYYVTGGARGVGVATTNAVVISSVLVLISDYMMTAVMFGST
jgi:phospholipid/cholesterol/gamma-HCH transport system permease protein